MKVKIKKIKILSIMTSLLLLGNSISVFANEQKLYQAYSQRAETFQTPIYRVIDGKGPDGKDNIVYCYDHEYNMPGIKHGDSEGKTYYTKIKSYLESNDPYTEKYGKEKKQRIAAVLVAGYPVDAYGLFKKFGITADQAIDMTQSLIWHINENTEGELSEYGSVTRNMAMYYNELWKYSKIEKFEQGKLNLQGKLEFVQRGNFWSTDKLSTIGDKGSFSFENLPKGIEVRDFNTDKVLNGDIKVGQEFYILSNDKPNEDLKLKIEYKYQEVELYFYKHHSGGIIDNSKPFQSLVRAELTDRIKEIPLEIKINGDFEKPEIPDIGGTTPNLPGEEGSTPSLPGDSGLGGITPNLPGGEGSTPSLPGDSGLGGTTPNLPGEEGITPSLPGDSGLGGNTPNLPGEEGSTPSLPGDSGLGGNTPNLPGEEGSTPSLPGDSGLGGNTPNLPGEEGSTPSLPGDSGLGGTTPNLPGEEGITPSLPGDSGLGGSTPNLPGEEGSTPNLPGDSGLGGSTPNLPGDSGLGGTTPNLPDDSGLGGSTPNLPNEEGSTPSLPGDSGLGGSTPNLPDEDDSKPGASSEENIKPEKPGNNQLVETTPLNPKTGDIGLLGSIGLVFASAVGLVVNKNKYKK